MKTTLKVLSIINIVIGGLAIIGSADAGMSAFLGGGLFLATGICTLVYIKGK